MIYLAQTDTSPFLTLLMKLLALADKDPVVLLALFLVLMGFYAVIKELAKFPGFVSNWRKRRKGETPIDPHLETQRLLAKSLDRVTESLDLLSKTQTTSVETQKTTSDTMRQLADRNTLLEDLVKQANQAMDTFSATITKIADYGVTSLDGAKAEMRGAQDQIVNRINQHADENVSGLAATISGIGATASGNAGKLSALDQKVTAHSTMTDEAFKKLMDRLETLPTKDELREALQQLQTELTTKNEKIAELTAQVAERDERLKNQTSVIQDLTAKQGKIPEEKPHEQTA